ncbi:hypothetical protein [Clostridium estertheticum]|nr:hypothetical protein [Clostridium estertheticum]
MDNIKYFEVRNKYLSQGLSFLGFKYMKFGVGKIQFIALKIRN